MKTDLEAVRLAHELGQPRERGIEAFLGQDRRREIERERPGHREGPRGERVDAVEGAGHVCLGADAELPAEGTEAETEPVEYLLKVVVEHLRDPCTLLRACSLL